ncbi:MAG TPA: FHA domain-containing protein [Miltoncostaeaceae bacterium]|nr:FHA domain-containing protein [Miltoncostaeaceae bacterium]
MTHAVTRCPTCGAFQNDAHRFCSECGSLLRPEGGHETTGPMPLPEIESRQWEGPHADGPTLAVLSGGPSGVLFPLPEGVVTIGRSPASDVFLDDVTVSRNHARIERDPGRIVLKDLGSLNGTYVNRRRIETEEVLENGDELQIGKFRLTYFSG